MAFEIAEVQVLRAEVSNWSRRVCVPRAFSMNPISSAPPFVPSVNRSVNENNDTAALCAAVLINVLPVLGSFGRHTNESMKSSARFLVRNQWIVAELNTCSN